MWRFRPTAFPIPPTVHQRIPTITKATIRRGCTTIERKHLAHGVAKATQSQYVTHAVRRLTTTAHTPSNVTPREPVPYPHQAIEAKWQEHWSKERAAEAASSTHTDAASRLLNSSKPPFYALSMFPYPSGALHMGHVRVYTISDTVARFMRMRGYEVLHPMGWDAFGLPAENAAIERGISPDTWTHQNIADMRKQMLALGLKFDWEAEIATCDPRYYKWTQWIFTQLHARGLAYQSDAGFVNWDPIDQTVLANEQVDNEGRSWRSGAIVEKKKLKQWYVRVTDYSDELLNDLSKLKGWPSQVKLMQKNWIGKSSGTKIVFELNAGSQASPSSSSTYELPVFTTRVDTLAGVTFIAVHISPFDRHPIIDQAVKDGTIGAEKLKEIQQYQEELNKMTDVQRNTHKAGVFTGLYAKHPLGLGDIPVYAASYVLSDYATGAVMGVPAHDTRDAAFAKCHGLESRVVIADAKSKDLDQPNSTKATVAPPLTSTEGVKLVNSGELDGLTPDEAATRIVAKLGQQRSSLTNSPVAESQSLYRLKDWLISRQRYWGAPIPIIHCPSCGPQSVPVEDLPVKLPELPRLSARGGSPLASTTCAVATEWRKCKCPKCGADSQRETDTLDTFVDSSWYFLRYLNRSSETAAFDPAVAKKFMPIPTYIGGIEHAILHLLYARFLTRFFYHIGLLSNPEPFDNLLTQGMVTGRTYKHPRAGKFIRESEVTFDGKTPFVIEKDADTGVESKTQLNVVWEKMSKSKYNGVEPTAVTKVFGADCIRLFILFKAPPQQVLDWEEQQIKGQQRYIQRVWTHVCNHRTAMESNPELAKLLQTPIDPSTVGTLSPADQLLYNQTNEVITGVTTQIDDRIFNVAISLLMKFINQIDDYLNSAGTSAITSPVYHHALSNMTLLLAPMTPHLASESWEHLMNARYAGSSVPKQAEVVDSQSWPIASSTGLASSTLTAVLMVGKKRIGQIELPNGEVQQNEDKLKEAVINSPLGVETFAGASIKRVVCIRQKNNPSVVIMNFVLA